MDQPSFTNLRHTAARLGVPASWLRQEAKAGRVPSLQAGRQLKFNIEEVRKALFDRAKETEQEPVDGQRVVTA